MPAVRTFASAGLVLLALIGLHLSLSAPGSRAGWDSPHDAVVPHEPHAGAPNGPVKPGHVETRQMVTRPALDGPEVVAEQPRSPAVNRRWDEDAPRLTVLNPHAPQPVLDLGVTPRELPPDVLRDALVLLDDWDQRMQDQRRKMLTRMSAVHGDKIRLGLDSAGVDSPLGTQLLALAEQDPRIRAHQYSVGADVLADGNPGQVVAVIRQGEDVVFDEALASLWELHDAALVDLKALLAPHL